MRYRTVRYYRPALAGPSRPNNAVNRGMYRLPFYSAIPLPTLPNVPQAMSGLGARPGVGSTWIPRRKKMRGLGDAGIPPGTVLQYTFTEGDLNWMGGTVSSVSALIALVQQGIASQNLSVLSSQDTSGFLSVSGTITVQAGGGGFAQAADVKSILDGVLTNLNYPPASSSISVIQTGGAPGVIPTPPPPPPPGQTFSAWMSANWPYLAGGGVALYLLKDLI
jgi:hypothetical protein